MKTLITAVIAAALASQSQAADLTVTIDRIDKVQGTLMISLFDSREAYQQDGKPFWAAKHAVVDKSVSFTLHGVPAGDYAAKVFHDENDNGSMDSNVLGIPSEGYGFSNNGGRFGPSSYEDAKFALQDQGAISIQLR